MSEHTAIVAWKRGEQKFTDNKYSRGHTWSFDGGVEVPASSAPAALPPPMSVAAAVDPEEALVASLSSCHMLWFLALAAKKGFVVDDYRDAAAGILGEMAPGRTGLTQVVLRPEARFSGEKRPTREDLAALHHEAHERCYIANSVKSEVLCEPVWTDG